MILLVRSLHNPIPWNMFNQTLWHVLPPTWSVSLAWRENMRSKREKARPPVVPQTINPTYVGQRRAISVYGCQPQWQATTTVAYLYGRPGFLSVAWGGSVLNITSAGTRSASYVRRITRWPGRDREGRGVPKGINGLCRERERKRETERVKEREGEKKRARPRQEPPPRFPLQRPKTSAAPAAIRKRKRKREKEKMLVYSSPPPKEEEFALQRNHPPPPPSPPSEAKGCISQLCFYSRFLPKSLRRFRLFSLMSRSILRVAAVGSSINSWETIRYVLIHITERKSIKEKRKKKKKGRNKKSRIRTFEVIFPHQKQRYFLLMCLIIICHWSS